MDRLQRAVWLQTWTFFLTPNTVFPSHSTPMVPFSLYVNDKSLLFPQFHTFHTISHFHIVQLCISDTKFS